MGSLTTRRVDWLVSTYGVCCDLARLLEPHNEVGGV